MLVQDAILNLLPYECVVSGSRAVPWDGEESIPRTHAWDTMVWQDLVGMQNQKCSALGFPMSHLRLFCHRKSPILSSSRPKRRLVPRVAVSFWSLWDLLWVPGGLDLHGCLWREYEMNGASVREWEREVEREGERDSLFPLVFIIRLGKNQELFQNNQSTS